MIVAPLTMTSEREEVVDFVAPYFDQSGIGIGGKRARAGKIIPEVTSRSFSRHFRFSLVSPPAVIRKPHQEPDLFKFMTVLRLEVWLSILAALFVTGILIWLLDTFSPYSAQNNKELYPFDCRSTARKFRHDSTAMKPNLTQNSEFGLRILQSPAKFCLQDGLKRARRRKHFPISNKSISDNLKRLDES